MTKTAIALVLSFCAAMVVFAIMAIWTLPTIQTEAGGMLPFDVRPGGYSQTEAQAFLAALSDEGRALYLGIQHQLDTAYPALLAIFLGLALWVSGAHLPIALRLLGIVAAVAGSAFDYVENARVALLLTAPVDQIDASLVTAASFATVWKSRLTTIAFALLLGFLAHKGISRLRNSRSHS